VREIGCETLQKIHPYRISAAFRAIRIHRFPAALISIHVTVAAYFPIRLQYGSDDVNGSRSGRSPSAATLTAARLIKLQPGRTVNSTASFATAGLADVESA